MADKQIHELTALPSTPATGNVLAIDTGTNTYKIDYDALANAIVNALAVKKTGDTMTGNLQINKSLPAIYLATMGTTQAYIRHNGTGKYLQLVQYNPDNGKYENYCLPVADCESDISYNVLTSKNPVTIAQGGTGATSAAAALANLGALQLVRYTTNSTEYTLDITPSNTYKFALIFADYGGPTSQDRAALYSLTVANTGVKVEVLAGTNARSCEASIVNGAVKLTFGGTMWGGIAVLVFN